MTQTTHPIHAVVAFDFSTSSSFALARAVDAACRAPDHVLHIISVIDPHERLFDNSPVTYETADKLHQMLVAHATAAFAGRPTAAEVQFYVHARIGKAAHEILELAREVGAQMIFIGSHGKTGVERMLLGSVSERVVREAHCSVIVARDSSYPSVTLAPVTFYEHERAPHREPHRYSYSTGRIITRPDSLTTD